METTAVAGVTLFFDADERDAADLIREACERSIRLIREHWGFQTPADCRVYVMTSWLRFVFHSAAWPRRLLLGAFAPVWCLRAMRVWRYAGGWTLPQGKRQAVGIKPPWLIQAADRSLGAQIFVSNDDMDVKVQHITCHELTHAFSSHLRLPMWLNEGLAMATVDQFAGERTVRPDTVERLGLKAGQPGQRAYGRIMAAKPDALIYQVVRGYWITCYLDEKHPDLLRSLLVVRHTHQALEGKIAAGLGMSPGKFWNEIDDILATHYRQG